jgi:AcrR family transcriptional regulator
MIRISKKPEERRREIVAASRELFLSKGYENTTMQDVMTKLEIAKGTAYHYFKSKEVLLDAVVENMVAEYIEIVEKALHKCTGNALEKIRALIAAGRIAPDRAEMMESLHSPGNMGMHMRLLAVTLSSLASLYASVISQGCEEKIFSVEHPLECAEILLAGIQFVTDTGCYPWCSHDLARRTQAIPEVIENLLRAPKGTFSFLLEKQQKPFPHSRCK